MHSGKSLVVKVRFSFIVVMITICFLHSALLFTSVSAQDVTWVTVEGTGPLHKSREEARSLAIKNAMRKAVEKVVGVGISTESLIINFKLSGGLVKAIPYGKVVDKQIVEEGIINIHKNGRDKPTPVYRVKMKTGVTEETSSSDSSFRLKTSLNQLNFKDGDEMLLNIKSTSDCYISVFIIMEDEKILRLIPNRFKKDNFLKAGKIFSFPDKKDRKKGIKLRAHLPENKEVVSEAIYILALKHPFQFNTVNFQEGIYGLYSGRTSLMNDLVAEIIGIPLNGRAEELIQYQISKVNGGLR